MQRYHRRNAMFLLLVLVGCRQPPASTHPSPAPAESFQSTTEVSVDAALLAALCASSNLPGPHVSTFRMQVAMLTGTDASLKNLSRHPWVVVEEREAFIEFKNATSYGNLLAFCLRGMANASSQTPCDPIADARWFQESLFGFRWDRPV